MRPHIPTGWLLACCLAGLAAGPVRGGGMPFVVGLEVGNAESGPQGAAQAQVAVDGVRQQGADAAHTQSLMLGTARGQSTSGARTDVAARDITQAGQGYANLQVMLLGNAQ